MLNKFLFWFTGRLPCRLIQLDSGPYLERYYLGQWKWLKVIFYLHRYVSSDSERHVHNHPWEWGGSLILAGSYIEERVIDICPHANDAGCWTKYRKVRWFNRVNCNTFHRVHNAKSGTWSLFFHGARPRIGGREKGWGFLSAVGIDMSADYVAEHDHSMPSNITQFVPYPVSHGNWWETYPIGSEAGREPL